MSKRGKVRPSQQPPAPGQEAEAATLHKLGIHALGDGEELVDDATFSDMQARLADVQGRGAAGDSSREEPVADEPGEDELLLEEIASEPPARQAAKSAGGAKPLSVPPTTPAEVMAVEAEIEGAADRDDVAELALRLARAYARVAALFVVHRGMVVGLCGRGDGIEQRIEGIMVPADAGSFLAEAVSTAEPSRGAEAATDVDTRLLRAMGRSEALDRLLVPVCIRGRVVNLLYADNGPDRMGRTSVAALAALGSCVARAYERLILERKQAGS